MRRKADDVTQARVDAAAAAPWLGPVGDDEVVLDAALRTAAELVAARPVTEPVAPSVTPPHHVPPARAA